MQVTIPPGVFGGLTMQVNTPSGRMAVDVPMGMVPGQTFTFKVPGNVAPPPVMAPPVFQQPFYQAPPSVNIQIQYSPQPQFSPPPMVQHHYHGYRSPRQFDFGW